MDETEEFQKEVEKIKEQRKRQGLPATTGEDESSEEEENKDGDDQ
jgi:hypothetical protein